MNSMKQNLILGCKLCRYVLWLECLPSGSFNFVGFLDCFNFFLYIMLCSNLRISFYLIVLLSSWD